MVYFQLSLFGKTSWEHFHQITGWILEPCWKPSQTPKFQCLLLEDGQMPEWCEGDALTSHGDLWTPNIGESPDWFSGENESFSWQILEDGALEKYYIPPSLCGRILHLAERVGCPPPKEIEYLLLKQGGQYQSSMPFKTGVCGATQKKATRRASSTALENQLTLFPRYLQGR